jgi:hypothetical protein
MFKEDLCNVQKKSQLKDVYEEHETWLGSTLIQSMKSSTCMVFSCCETTWPLWAKNTYPFALQKGST